MNSNLQNQYMSKLRAFSEILSIFIILISILFLIGWAFNIEILKTPGSDFSTIKSNTAFSFLLIGIIIWLLQEKRVNSRNILISRILSLIILLIGSFTLFEYISSINLGIDQILFSEPHDAFQTGALNRMSLVAVSSLLLISISLLTIDKEEKGNFHLFQLLIILVGLISFLVLLGYLYQTTIYPILNTTAPSLYGSVMLFIIFLAIIASRPNKGFMKILTSKGVAGVFARRIIPSIIIIPLILGWLRLLGEHMGLYDAEFGTAITIFFTILILAILVWLSIVSIDNIDVKRFQAEENIKRQAELINLTHDAIFVRNMDDEITFWNKGSEETYGWSRDEALGRVTHDLLQSEYPEPLDEIQEDVLNYGQWDGELTHKKRDGTSIMVLSRWSLQKDESGKPLGFLEINTDITKRKEAQEKLKELVEELKRSNYELQQFTYITSHDLQEPLRSIASFAQLLGRRYNGKIDSSADEYIDFIVDGAMRMKEMIQGLLEYSLVGKGENFQLTDVNETIDIVLSNLKRLIDENEAEITHERLPTVTADSRQLVQIFQNLIVNAVKFKKPETRPKIRISAYLDTKKKEYIFSVSDNGIGIEKQYSDKIFDIFKRLHTIDEYRGTGIGLAICKRIVEHHGGKIWVESKYGAGSTFYFTIPINPVNS
ncbi:sensor histidine kinase [Methanobacterium veterum]|jgi:PAS domain S-box-containing protein|uniref:histidine kinase n=1 Tax=Methanobacterium veterum TaxID=408577 RepID=A0A9E4ZRK9_9EURY|nr:ATP-binding protein [Methanobacterium veterum]MCZ3364447.1 ATP-binding protein [Methanobacterium veterum]